MEQRLKRLRSHLDASGVDGILVTHPENRRYLSGFTGSAGYLLITGTDAVLMTDFRYTEQAANQAASFEIVQLGATYETIRLQLAKHSVKRVGFEKNHVTYAVYEQMKQTFQGIALVPLDAVVEILRQVKDDREVAVIRQAAKIADQAFAHVLNILAPGVTEREVAIALETFMRQSGASGTSFDTIVASGKRSSLPHGLASDKPLEKGDFVTLDFGALYEGYCSDITRTIVIGHVTDKQQEIYHMVLEAQLKALDAIRPGMTGEEADAIARDFLAQKGYAERFGHSLGHGIGLAIHEEPRLGKHVKTVLEPGMVVTVEPGVYIPNFGGVRIEDDIVITENGCEILTKSSKELLVIQ